MIRIKVSLLIVTIAAATAAGCGIAGREPASPPSVDRSGFDPFRYGDEFASQETTSGGDAGVRQQIPPSETPSQAEPESGAGETRGTLPGARTYDSPTANGYRVQIGIDENKERMEKLVEYARSKTDEKVYLEFEAPFYRVRVGDFRTREEAERCVRTMKNSGFDDALWVMSAIYVQ